MKIETNSEEITEFITRRFGDSQARWFTGNCFWFASILVNRFPYLTIFYEPITGHFVAGACDHYYDASGEIVPEYQPISMTEIKETDELLYNRLIRDCVL